MTGYRPAYLAAVELSRKRLHRDDRAVYLTGEAIGHAPDRFVGQKLGSVKLVHNSLGSCWVIAGPLGAKAYATAKQAAEALAITLIEGSAQCAAFDAERVKRQAS